MSGSLSLRDIPPRKQEIFFDWLNNIISWLVSINFVLELGEYRYDFKTISCDSSGKYWINYKTVTSAVKYKVQLCIDTGDGTAFMNGSQGGIAIVDTDSRRWILLEKVIFDDEGYPSFEPEVFVLTTPPVVMES